MNTHKNWLQRIFAAVRRALNKLYRIIAQVDAGGDVNDRE